MRQTYSISFYCRKCNMSKKTLLSPVEVSIIINGKRCFAQCQMKANPEEFQKQMASAKQTQLKAYCDTVRRKLNDLTQQLLENDIPLTAETLRNYFRNNSIATEYTLQNLFDDYMYLQQKRVGKDITETTYQRYYKAIDMFLKLLKLNGDFPANKITREHILNFQAELNQLYQQSNSRNYLIKIKAIFKYGFENNKIKINPFNSFRIARGVKNDILYLTNDELNKLKAHYIENDRLCKVRDCFLFSCYTGLSFSDMMQLEPSDYKKNDLNQIYIDKERQKTHIHFCAILLEDALEIAKKYDYQLPKISNQKTNAYLKEIANICGIDKPLHFHMARHTAAFYYLNYRPSIPSSTICKIMGWNSERMLRHYADLMNTTVFSDIRKVQNRNTLNKILKKEGAV